MKYQIPKGLFDILPYGADQDWRLTNQWQYMEWVIHRLARDYGYFEMRTPIFEKTEVFHHSVGASTDIVSKEMYTFLDKAERSMSLRPEGTASIVRAFVEKNLAQHGNLHKFYYIGPMFRYERMQKGRYRQFHQFGIEAIGPMSAELDVEVIDLLNEFFKRLGLKDITIQLNSVGTTECRLKYKKKLLEYLTPHFKKLSKDSQERFEKNPLRILDSKDPEDKKLIEKAPSILDMLSKEAKEHFKKVCNLLKTLKIPYEINDKLVRGLDYYTNTVFEFVSSHLGAQNAIGAGGRYDSLVGSFGGPDLPGVGFATGLERVVQTMVAQKVKFPSLSFPFVYFIPLSSSVKDFCFEKTTELRHLSIPSEMDTDAKKIQKSLQKASKSKAIYCAILGDEEWQNKQIQLKNLETREQKNIALDDLIPTLQSYWKDFSQKNKLL